MTSSPVSTKRRSGLRYSQARPLGHPETFPKCFLETRCVQVPENRPKVRFQSPSRFLWRFPPPARSVWYLHRLLGCSLCLSRCAFAGAARVGVRACVRARAQAALYPAPSLCVCPAYVWLAGRLLPRSEMSVSFRFYYLREEKGGLYSVIGASRWSLRGP